MPLLRSAPAPVKRSSGVSPGSATRMRSGRSSPALGLDHLQHEADGGMRAELVGDLDPEPERARLGRRARDLTGLGVELQPLRKDARPAADDRPRPRTNTAGRLQAEGVLLADLRIRQGVLDEREVGDDHDLDVGGDAQPERVLYRELQRERSRRGRLTAEIARRRMERYAGGEGAAGSVLPRPLAAAAW